MQWRNEIASHTEGLEVLVWHGASRMTDVKQLKKYDVVCTWRLLRKIWLIFLPQVLTTYAVLESCFRKQQNGFKRKGKIIKEKSPMHLIKWNRIIVRFFGILVCMTAWSVLSAWWGAQYQRQGHEYSESDVWAASELPMVFVWNTSPESCRWIVQSHPIPGRWPIFILFL